jgi:hypothetical protein
MSTGGTRADRGDDRDTLAGRHHQAPRLDIERAHQLALGKANEIAAVDDIGAVLLKPRAGASQPRNALGERQHVGHEHATALAVVTFDNGQGALAQRLHRGEPREADDLAEHHHQQREPREQRQGQSDRAEPRRPRIQVFDQVGDGQSQRQQHEARQRRPEQRRPRDAALARRSTGGKVVGRCFGDASTFGRASSGRAMTSADRRR